MNTRQKGKWGEALALEFFLRRGYTYVGTGFRTRYGEIDVIVKNAAYIVFAEVKVRKNDRFAEAREFVDSGKQERLRKTAQLWLVQNDTQLQPRFDVVEIYAPLGPATANPSLNHIENAF